MANKPILRNPNGFGLVKGTGALNPGGRPVENWRAFLRKQTRNGAEIHEILLSLARGKPTEVKLKDGRETLIIPDANVIAKCAIHLDEMLHGKAVSQNEQQRAEREASAMEAVRALSDADLEARVLAALERKATARNLPEITIPENIE